MSARPHVDLDRIAAHDLDLMSIEPSTGTGNNGEPVVIRRLSEQEAHDLIKEHLPLVGHLVREAMGRMPAHAPRDDFASAGHLALVQATKAFDPDRGVPFTKYASRRIRGAILDEMRAQDWAPRSVRRLARDVEETRSRLATDLGIVPTNQMIASELGVPVEAVRANVDDVDRARVHSLDLTMTETGADAFEALIPSNSATPEEDVLRAEKVHYVSAAVAALPERLRIVVEDYFLRERPMADIAEDLGVSDSRISQMRAEALVLLRDAVHNALDPHLVPGPTGRVGVGERRRQGYFSEVATRASRHRLPSTPVPEQQQRSA